MKSHCLNSGRAKQKHGTRLLIRKWLILASIALMMLSSTRLGYGQGLLYTVDSTGDGGNVGSDNFCDDGTGHCTLRAAIEASNGHPGEDGIEIDIPTTDPNFNGIFWTINLTAALPDLTESVSISGPGADQLTVRRDTGGDYRIFTVTTTGLVTFSGMTISDGVAPVVDQFGNSFGGGIQNVNAGTVNVTDCTVNGNSAKFGGGIQNDNSSGTVNVTNCMVSGNSAAEDGGGISNNGTVTVTNCTLSGNNATASGGGGILNQGTRVNNVTNSTLSGNSAGLDGGGIFNINGTVNVTNCTLSGNSVANTGGGIFNNGTVSVTNCTLSGNHADGSDGGGIFNNGTVTVTNCTLSGNSAAVGGGILNNGPTTNVKSSIVALNTASNSSPDLNGSFNPQGFNLIGNNGGAAASFPAGNPNANNDIVGTSASPVDPKLDPNGLQNNGGPTQTIALVFGSPAIDKGTSIGSTGTLITDQRGTGFARAFDDPAIPNAVGGDGTDIGAFEVQAPTPNTLGNISTRLRVETGDNVLIGGFIITGSQAKKVMVRAIGPSLPLVGVLADPTLELHDGAGTLITSNDNWMDAPNKQEIIDSTIPPTNDLESAILMSLDPGLYTAIVRGVNDTTGIALVEAYDLDLGADSILANISTRGLVQTGDNVMIGGIIILGTDAQEVLLRAIGPSLPLTGALADPTLELHDKDGVIIATNDDWRTDQEADIMATTIPPTDDAESAILATLTPDAYTAIVRGKDNTTGVALVEAYQLDN
jgi:hypothetical protein